MEKLYISVSAPLVLYRENLVFFTVIDVFGGLKFNLFKIGLWTHQGTLRVPKSYLMIE